MNKVNFLIIGLLLCLLGCDKIELNKELSDCMEIKIEKFSHEIECEKGANVKEYTFQNGKVYVFDFGNCGTDFTIGVYSEECELIGLLGGFAGNSIINGEEFSNAIFKCVVWDN